MVRAHLDRRLSVGALMLSSLIASGCHATRVQTDPAAALAQPVDLAVVTLSDGSRVKVRHASVRSDSLVGASAIDDSRLALPMNRVQTVEVSELSASRTTLAVVGSIVAVTALLLFAAASTLSGLN